MIGYVIELSPQSMSPIQRLGWLKTQPSNYRVGVFGEEPPILSHLISS